jgi:group I intron endonuclease
MIGIYKITNPKGKIYIGQSINIDNRKIQYERYGCKNQTLLNNSIKKYGWSTHVFEIIEECTLEYLDEKETYWKIFFNSVENGLNFSYYDNSPMRGRKHSLTSKIKIGNSRRGKTHTLKTKKKMSKNSGQRGVPRSEHQKNQIRKANTGRKLGPETINKMSTPILQYDIDGKFIKEWSSISSARKKLGKGLPLQPKHGVLYSQGYLWTYKTENYPLSIKPYKNPLSTEILQYDLEGKFIKEWSSISEAERQYKGGVKLCVQGKQKTACNFIWKRKTENYPLIIDPPAPRKIHNLEKLKKSLNKEIIQFNMNGGYINSFSSMKEAENSTGISAYNISGCVRNKQKTAGGYIWKYKN